MKMFKFKDGGKVKIIGPGKMPCSKMDEYYWIPQMENLRGETLTISHHFYGTMDGFNYYFLEKYVYGWREDWLSGIDHILPDRLFEI